MLHFNKCLKYSFPSITSPPHLPTRKLALPSLHHTILIHQSSIRPSRCRLLHHCTHHWLVESHASETDKRLQPKGGVQDSLPQPRNVLQLTFLLFWYQPYTPTRYYTIATHRMHRGRVLPSSNGSLARNSASGFEQISAVKSRQCTNNNQTS